MKQKQTVRALDLNPPKPQPPAPNCGNCAYFDMDSCARFPPTIFLMPDGKPKSFWPDVSPADTCGEFKRRG